MSKLTLLTALLATSLLFQACSKKEDHAEDTAKKANALLSTNEFVLTSLTNKEYVLNKQNNGLQLKNAKDKILLIDIFASWCPPCQAEASHLSSLQKKYPNQLKVIGVTVEDGVPNATLQNFAQQHNANYTLVNSDQNRRIVDEVAKELHLGRDFGIPLMVLYKDGKIISYYQGATEEEFIESDIKKALGK